MGILVNENTYALVQGITGREGSFHTKLMLEYGTKILAGVTPGKGGQNVHGVPVFNSVREALHKFPKINSSIVFVPAKFAKDAILEAIYNGIKLIVVITEHIPVHDEIFFIRYARLKGTIIVGPNTPGIINPHVKCKLGIMPAKFFKPGCIGLVSRSGTLAYEVARLISEAGYGISTFIGVGGDPIVGFRMVEVIREFFKDKQTKAIVMLGEIGGTMEEEVAEFLETNGLKKPVIAFIAGKSAPPGKRMGHAGAIIYGKRGSAQSKIKLLKKAGAEIAFKLSDIVNIIRNLI